MKKLKTVKKEREKRLRRDRVGAKKEKQTQGGNF